MSDISSRLVLAAASQYVRHEAPTDNPRLIVMRTFGGRRFVVEVTSESQLAEAEASEARRTALPLVTTPVELPAPAPGPAATRPGLWYSPEEEQIAIAMADGGWHTSQELADATHQQKNNSFMCLLGNLARREIIESSQRNGYRLLR
jgi:hypothetical protein